MIYTVTFNPAIDYVIQMDDLMIGEVNRTRNEEIFYGGKGINVSVILSSLGVKNKALGFVAGFTGMEIEKGLAEQNVASEFIKLKNGNSRINIKIKSSQETEINGQGPDIPDEELHHLFRQLDVLTEGDCLVLAGSVPKTLPEDVYERILERLQDKGIKFVVDATGELLMNVLQYKPFLIKPNVHELGAIFQKRYTHDSEIAEDARKLKEKGAMNVLISMAGDGAILVTEDGQIIKMGVPKGNVVNSVGAGDSMVAGFLAGYMEQKDYNYALRLGTAAGSATAFSKGLGSKESILGLLDKI